VRVHVGDGRDADARRLDDVDGVDADARTDVARRRVVPRYVGRDDGGDDAAVLGPNAVALPPGRWQDRRASVGGPRSWGWVTSSSGPCSEWPLPRWASRWRRSRCSSHAKAGAESDEQDTADRPIGLFK